MIAEDWPIVAKYGNWRDEGIYVTISFPNGKQYVGVVKEWEGVEE